MIETCLTLQLSEYLVTQKYKMYLVRKMPRVKLFINMTTNIYVYDTENKTKSET